MRLRRGLPVIGGVVIPATLDLTVDPLLPTYHIKNDVWAPRALATIEPVVASGPIAWSLSGAHSVGFDITSAGVLRLASRRRMIDTGVRLNLLKNRQFDIVATVGAVSARCAVAITLDTSAYAEWTLPGLDVAVGCVVANLMQVAGVDNLPSGWSITTDANGRRISANVNSPPPLENWDITDYWIETNGKAGVVLDNVRVTITPAALFPPFQWGIIRNSIDAGDGNRPILRNVTVDCGGDVFHSNTNGLSGYFGEIANLAVIAASNDVADLQAADGPTNLYGSTASTANYTADRSALRTNYTQWLHSDGVQTFNMTGTVDLNKFLLINENISFAEGARLRSPAGTASLSGFPSASSTITGSGTSWLTGGDNDRISVGEALSYAGSNQRCIVIAVNSDTSLTIGHSSLQTVTGKALIVGAGDDARAGSSSPVYIGGLVTGAGGIDLDYDQTARNGVSLGGTYPIQTNSPASGGGKAVDAIIKWQNVGFGDYFYSPPVKLDSSWADTATVQNCKTLFDRDTLALSIQPLADIRPVPTTPAVSFGVITSSSIAFSVPSQGAGVVFEYRIRASSGPGAWSAWTDVTGTSGAASGLSSATGYDIEVRGKNCLATSGAYLQFGAAGSGSASTS